MAPGALPCLGQRTALRALTVFYVQPQHTGLVCFLLSRSGGGPRLGRTARGCQARAGLVPCPFLRGCKHPALEHFDNLQLEDSRGRVCSWENWSHESQHHQALLVVRRSKG